MDTNKFEQMLSLLDTSDKRRTRMRDLNNQIHRYVLSRNVDGLRTILQEFLGIDVLITNESLSKYIPMIMSMIANGQC